MNKKDRSFSLRAGRRALEGGKLVHAKLEADVVILSAARVLRFDPRKLVDETGKPKKLHELDDETALALSSFDLDGVNVSKVRVDRSTARERLMKHLGLFKEGNSQKPGVEVHVPGARIEFTPIPKTRKR